MSAGLAECEILEDFSLDGAPPCEILTGTYRAGVLVAEFPCGRPAVARIRFSCSCGRAVARFVCASDLEDLRKKRIYCPGCDSTDFDWRET